MTPDRWARIVEIFGQALELPVTERKEFVQHACVGNEELCNEILRLLETHERRGAFLDSPIARSGFLTEAASGSRFRKGQLVSGRFRITRFLGEGGMGEVYAAEDVELRAPVAIKTLHSHLAGSAQFEEKFRREIQLARQVTHPNVCRIFDAGRNEGVLYLTMELLDGETLAAHLDRAGRLTLEDAAPIVNQLCAGLAAAHYAGILHRDFKSANVMLSGPRAVITDFGLARLLETDDSGNATSGIAIGTPAYMAPEQIEGGPAGASADIYALGVVMYEMATGRRPYESSSPLALAAKKIKGLPPPPRQFTAGISPVWESVILKCLAAKPEDRFASAKEVADAMAGSTPVRATLHVPVRKLTWGAAVAATLLLGAWGGRTLLERLRPHKPPAEALRWYQQGVDAMSEGAFLKASNLLKQAVSLDDHYIAAHARLAEAYAELDMGEAKDEVIHAASLAPDRSKLPPLDAQLLDAAQYKVARDFGKSEDVYRAIAQAAPSLEKGRAYLDLGRAAEKANHTAKAMEAYQQAAANSPGREAALLHLGMLSSRNDAAKAAEQFTEAERLFRLSSNFEGVTEVKLALARLYERSRLPEADWQAREAVQMTKLTGNLQQQIRSLFELSQIKLLQGHADQARSVADAAIDLADRNHLDNLSVQGLNDLAAASSRQLQWQEAEVQARRAIDLAKRSKSRVGEARAEIYLAQALAQLSDNDGALQHIGRAVPFYREGGIKRELLSALTLECDVYCNTGRYSDAKKDATEMEKRAREMDDPQQVSTALSRIAEPLVFEGAYANALDVYRRATTVDKQSGRLGTIAYDLANQGDVLWRLGRYSESDARLNEADVIVKELGEGGKGPRGRLELVQANSSLSQLRYNDARTKAMAALASAQGGTAQRIVESRVALGLALARMGRTAEGGKLCAQALQAAETSGNPMGISIAKIASAEAALIAGEFKAAEAYAKEGRDNSRRYGQREQALRALLIQWNLARRSNAAGVRDLATQFDLEAGELEKSWGEGMLAMYLRRPDIHNLLPTQK